MRYTSLLHTTALFLFPVLIAGCAPVQPDSDVGAPINQADIRVNQPLPNSTITDPLTVSGEARGGWYFEASFPIRIKDAQGNEIAVGIAQAQGDWMTDQFVPFIAVIPFSTTAQTGMVVLEKDNPSGLPENAASVSIPVKFGS